MSETTTMDKQHFGRFLREARESQNVSLAEVAAVTKVCRSTLLSLEEAALDDLPPEIFVRGFVKSYARTVGISDAEPLALLDEMLEARRREQALATGLPVAPDGELVPLDALPKDEDFLAPKRGVGLAIFVVIVLVIATITVSYLMRQPPAPGEGLSEAPEPPAPAEVSVV